VHDSERNWQGDKQMTIRTFFGFTAFVGGALWLLITATGGCI
jgi:hypothetical protein